MNLKNVCLYAKGWYKKSDDLIEDLKKCLNADDYTPDCKNDVTRIMLNNLCKIPWMMRNGIEYYTYDLLEGINPNTCWKFGYYTKENYKPTGKDIEEGLKLPEYDYETAIIHYCLSTLRFMETKEIGELPKPTSKVLPLNHSGKKIKEFWANKVKEN